MATQIPTFEANKARDVLEHYPGRGESPVADALIALTWAILDLGHAVREAGQATQ